MLINLKNMLFKHFIKYFLTKEKGITSETLPVVFLGLAGRQDSVSGSGAGGAVSCLYKTASSSSSFITTDLNNIPEDDGLQLALFL